MPGHGTPPETVSDPGFNPNRKIIARRSERNTPRTKCARGKNRPPGRSSAVVIQTAAAETEGVQKGQGRGKPIRQVGFPSARLARRGIALAAASALRRFDSRGGHRESAVRALRSATRFHLDGPGCAPGLRRAVGPDPFVAYGGIPFAARWCLRCFLRRYFYISFPPAVFVPFFLRLFPPL